jgi:hypothetical protein
MLLRTILHLMSVDVGQSEALPDSLRRSLTDLLRYVAKRLENTTGSQTVAGSKLGTELNWQLKPLYNLSIIFRATLKIRSCLERQVDPFAPRTKKTLQEVQEDFSFSRWRHRSLLLPELLEGVLQVGTAVSHMALYSLHRALL